MYTQFIAVLIMGPVFILPRVSSATHEMAIAQFFPSIPIWVTLLVYFALNYYFAYNRSKVIDKMGKYLAPGLIIFMIILVIKGVFAPLASVPPTGVPSAFSDGILNGYNTMNALGALIFGIWIVNELKRRGIEEEKVRSSQIIIIGLIASTALFLTSIGLTYLGASTGSFVSRRTDRRPLCKNRGWTFRDFRQSCVCADPLSCVHDNFGGTDLCRR